LPTLGSILRVKRDSNELLMVASAQMYPMYEVTAEGLDITVCVDSVHRIRWVSTADTDFVSPEGLRVGDPIERALVAADAGVISEPGWAWYVRLPSGWNARVAGVVETRDGPRLFFPQHDAPDPPSGAVIGDFFKRQ
jgi:hypothetical protein